MEKRDLTNPANSPVKSTAERKRIPMSLPVQKLQVPDIPGFHLHWMRGDQARIQQAQQAGYEFVRPEEIHVNNVGIGNNSVTSGNTDLGSLVSIVGGGIGDDNQPVRLVLMKIKEEWWQEDQEVAQKRNDSVRDALVGGQLGAALAADRGETNLRYVDKSKTKLPAMFTKKIPQKTH